MRTIQIYRLVILSVVFLQIGASGPLAFGVAPPEVYAQAAIEEQQSPAVAEPVQGAVADIPAELSCFDAQPGNAGAMAPSSEPGGDLNCDGQIDAVDTIVGLRVVAGFDEAVSLATDDDGRVDLTDVIAGMSEIGGGEPPGVAPISASTAAAARALGDTFVCYNVNTLWVESWHDPAFLNGVNRLKPQMLRFPGGTVADFWDWQRGGLIEDFSDLQQVPSSYNSPRVRQYDAAKLADFKAGLEATHQTAPLFVLNILTSSLEEQLNMLKAARDIGIAVQYIQLGNESYFSLPDSMAVFPTAADYAEMAEEWSLAIRQEFPEALISAIGVSPIHPKMAEKERFQQWNEAVLNISENIDAISFNLYSDSGLTDDGSPQPDDYPYFSLDEVAVMLSIPHVRLQELLQNDMYQAMSARKQIWITEYNLIQRTQEVTGSWAHGLYVMLMSLLYLEDQNIASICNHSLIGNSRFGAMFADKQYIGQNIFINPSEPVSVAPFDLSATGSARRLLGEAVQDMTSASQITFSEAPVVNGLDGLQYNALYGWILGNGEEERALIMNLSDQELSVSLSDGLFQTGKFKQISGDPRTLVTTPGSLTEKCQNFCGRITLPAYSVTSMTSLN